MFVHWSHTLAQALGRPNQPRDRRGRWTATGAGARLGSQRGDFARALQAENPSSNRDNDGRSTVYAYMRDKDSPSGKAGSPYYVGVAGNVTRPYDPKHGRTPVPLDERRIRVLRQGVTHEQAREWEKYYIEKFGRKDIKSGRGMLLNRTDGGDGVANPSAEHRRKIGAARRGKTFTPEQKTKVSAGMKGRVLSDETKAKISASNKGKIRSAETKARVSAAKKGAVASAETKAKLSAMRKGKQKSQEHVASYAAARVRNSASRLGVNPDDWTRLSPAQRRNAVSRAKSQSITPAQYVDKMRSRWGI